MAYYDRNCDTCGREFEDCECIPVDDDCDDPQLAEVGTPACSGTCSPTCAWCLAAHDCPGECGGGGACPYAALGATAEDVTLRQQGEAVATAVENRRPHNILECDPIQVLNVAAAVSRRRARKRASR